MRLLNGTILLTINSDVTVEHKSFSNYIIRIFINIL